MGHDGRRLSAIGVGDGVDNIDYVERRHELYAAAGRAATLTIVRLDRRGGLTPRATVLRVVGARNAVASDEGTAYLTDWSGAKIPILTPLPAR